MYVFIFSFLDNKCEKYSVLKLDITESQFKTETCFILFRKMQLWVEKMPGWQLNDAQIILVNRKSSWCRRHDTQACNFPVFTSPRAWFLILETCFAHDPFWRLQSCAMQEDLLSLSLDHSDATRLIKAGPSPGPPPEPPSGPPPQPFALNYYAQFLQYVTHWFNRLSPITC